MPACIPLLMRRGGTALKGILRKTPTGSVKGAGAKRWAVLTQGTLTYYHSTNEYMTGHKPGKSINLAVGRGDDCH